MLLSLAIRNFVIVESLELDFAPGFTVLTGETGAGKSILIDALLLALGERADADVVREGAPRAEISAEFRAGAAVVEWMQSQDVGDADEASVLVRRTIDSGGRSKSYINGSPVTLAQLRELGELLLDVHGQHAHQSLLKSAAQLALLDEHGGLAGERRELGKAWADWKREQRAREEAEAMAASALAEQDRLRWIVEELDALAPQPGEWDTVQAEHKRLSHAAGLLEGVQAAVDALAESDGSALAQVGNVSGRITHLVPYDERLQPAVELIDAAQIQLDEAVARRCDATSTRRTSTPPGWPRSTRGCRRCTARRASSRRRRSRSPNSSPRRVRGWTRSLRPATWTRCAPASPRCATPGRSRRRRCRRNARPPRSAWARKSRARCRT